jgi:hypothetical protein
MGATLSGRTKAVDALGVLPLDVCFLVLSRMDLQYIGRCGCVSRAWRTVVDRDVLWTLLFRQHFGCSPAAAVNKAAFAEAWLRRDPVFDCAVARLRKAIELPEPALSNLWRLGVGGEDTSALSAKIALRARQNSRRSFLRQPMLPPISSDDDPIVVSCVIKALLAADPPLNASTFVSVDELPVWLFARLSKLVQLLLLTVHNDAFTGIGTKGLSRIFSTILFRSADPHDMASLLSESHTGPVAVQRLLQSDFRWTDNWHMASTHRRKL